MYLKHDPTYSWIPESPLFDSDPSWFIDISHLASLDLRFSFISAFSSGFPSGFSLNNLLEADPLTLHSLELEYRTSPSVETFTSTHIAFINPLLSQMCWRIPNSAKYPRSDS